MPLSRLENFLKNIQGNVIYVDPNELDATDSIENQGNSQTRPFKTIQRALIEASRFSYVAGQRNDKFDLTTIILAAGTHFVDNRPGWIPYNSSGDVRYYSRFGLSNQVLSPFGLGSNFDLTSSDNELYKLNSVRGGVIIPRGTSIVGKDLRKTKISPKYIPDPENSNIASSSVFRVTGASYISSFTIFDGDPAGNVYKDYTANVYTPSFSHHKLTCFEYVDGANAVTINDSCLNVSATSTDLDMYDQKVGDVYDSGTGRPIEPDFPSGSMDFQTRVEEYRIVGSTGQSVGISSIKAGTGAVSSTTITVDMSSSLTDLSIDTPVRISGISTSGFNGVHVVSEDLIPDKGTRYVSCDPAGNKNWFLKWYILDDIGRVFLYREFPDRKNYGEWALPSEKADGKPGPAQTLDMGKSIISYKKIILESEGWAYDEETKTWDNSEAEKIYERLIDPRMGGAAVPSIDEGTSIISLLEDEQKDKDGNVVGPSLLFIPAPGGQIDEGLQLINDYLDFDNDKPVTALNSPKYFISENCEQTIYAMQEYTGRDGLKGALKDVVDCDRYLFKAGVMSLDGNFLEATGGDYYEG